HALEFGDHHVELQQVAPLFTDLELLQPNKILSRFHDRNSYTLRTTHYIMSERYRWRSSVPIREKRHSANKVLTKTPAGNLSFTGIVNHRSQALRHGKN